MQKSKGRYCALLSAALAYLDKVATRVVPVREGTEYRLWSQFGYKARSTESVASVGICLMYIDTVGVGAIITGGEQQQCQLKIHLIRDQAGSDSIEAKPEGQQ